MVCIYTNITKIIYICIDIANKSAKIKTHKILDNNHIIIYTNKRYIYKILDKNQSQYQFHITHIQNQHYISKTDTIIIAVID